MKVSSIRESLFARERITTALQFIYKKFVELWPIKQARKFLTNLIKLTFCKDFSSVVDVLTLSPMEFCNNVKLNFYKIFNHNEQCTFILVFQCCRISNRRTIICTIIQKWDSSVACFCISHFDMSTNDVNC
jgi:hypothetical protein